MDRFCYNNPAYRTTLAERLADEEDSPPNVTLTLMALASHLRIRIQTQPRDGDASSPHGPLLVDVSTELVLDPNSPFWPCVRLVADQQGNWAPPTDIQAAQACAQPI